MLILRWYLDIAPNLLCGASLAIAIRKGLHRRFPAFIALLAFNVVGVVLALTIAFLLPLKMYKWFIVSDVAISFGIEVLVLAEILRELFATSSFPRIVLHLPRWTAGGLALIAAAFAASLPQTATERVQEVFQSLNFGVNLTFVGLSLAMIIFSRVFAISWRSLPAGIVLGLAITATSDTAASVLMARFGRPAYIGLDMLRMTGFHICAVIWLAYVLLPERASKQSSASRLELAHLQGRAQELQEFIDG